MEKSCPHFTKIFKISLSYRELETDEDLLDLVIKSTDSAHDKLNQDRICCVINDEAIDIDIIIYPRHNERSEI